MDPPMFSTSADAGGKLWQALDIISWEMGHIPLKKIYQSIPCSDSQFYAFSKILVLIYKPPGYDLGNHTL